MASDKELKDQGQGSYEMKEASVDGVKLLAMKSIDKYSVIVLLPFDSVEPIKTVKRYDKKEKKFIELQCPAAIANYSKYMSGVDLLDAFLSYYQMCCPRNGIIGLLCHFFDLALIQGWILHKKLLEEDSMCMKNFKLSVADA